MGFAPCRGDSAGFLLFLDMGLLAAAIARRLIKNLDKVSNAKPGWEGDLTCYQVGYVCLMIYIGLRGKGLF